MAFQGLAPAVLVVRKLVCREREPVGAGLQAVDFERTEPVGLLVL